MVMRQTLIEIKLQKDSDGMGGFNLTETAIRDIFCKISNVSSPELLNMYGQHGEDVLRVFSDVELSADNIYMYNNKRFSLRKIVKNNRLFYSVLVEIK